jgi:hypothetical protein
VSTDPTVEISPSTAAGMLFFIVQFVFNIIYKFLRRILQNTMQQPTSARRESGSNRRTRSRRRRNQRRRRNWRRNCEKSEEEEDATTNKQI